MQGVWKESSAAELHWQPHNNSPFWRFAGDIWDFGLSVHTARLRQQRKVGWWRAPVPLC